MMREENRPVTIRLIFLPPSEFPADKGPPKGFQRLVFSTKRPFNEYELRRMFPAVDFERSIVGVEYSENDEFQIWGIVNSGIRWLQIERGGVKQSNKLPNSLVVHVGGPGILTVCCGLKPLAVLSSGKVVNNSANVFQSIWMKKLFTDAREDILASHEAFRQQVDYPVAKIEEDFIESLQGQLLKRIISVTKMANHGGTFLIFPGNTPSELSVEAPQILLKYKFQEDEAMLRLERLYLKTIQTVTTLLGDKKNPDKVITWEDYIGLRDEKTYDLEEALYEQAQLIASLAAVDGAVAVTRQGAIGFGGMIVGSLDQLTEIAIANDIEGKVVNLEKIEGAGSRHRSVYHFCNALHNVVALVVSQDGMIQIVKWRNGIVTCWDLTSATFTDDYR